MRTHSLCRVCEGVGQVPHNAYARTCVATERVFVCVRVRVYVCVHAAIFPASLSASLSVSLCVRAYVYLTSWSVCVDPTHNPAHKV